MTLATLVLAHNLIFLARYGAAYGEALAHTGHDHGWSSAVLTVLAAAGACLTVAVLQLRRLTALARDAGAGTVEPPTVRPFVRRWLRLTACLVVVTALLLILQENLEHLGIGKPLPGLGVLLSPEYPNAIPIVALVAAAVAFVGALFGWRFATLRARIRGVRTRQPLPPRARVPDALDVDRRPGTLLGPGLAVRAPPAAFAA
jgi:hypothetical protein